ncbi:MAG TPA: endonuclease III, partial [Planctomycetaceae bacterium]|nr:endonuclease III [Planctomycetaceae bacterium]
SEFSGVGPKTIACVLLFACGKPVLPVDTHVYRVSRRLQLIGAKTTVVKAHEVLGSIVPSELVLEFHLQLIKLGRTICLARSPRCDACPLADICPTATGARWS